MLPRLGTRKLHYMIAAQLRHEGLYLGRDRLFKLLEQHGMLIRSERRYTVRTTNSNHWMRKYPNLIKEVEIVRPHQVWVSDLTYLRLEPEYRYLSLITDAYSHKILGYALTKGLDAQGPVRALRQAMQQWMQDGKPGPVIHHSDRGSQYCCKEYTQLLEHHGMSISMTEQGDPYENAVAERLNGILKYEFNLVQGFDDHAQAVRQVTQAIEMYNTVRPHLSCDYLTPQLAHQSSGKLKKHWSKKILKPVK